MCNRKNENELDSQPKSSHAYLKIHLEIENKIVKTTKFNILIIYYYNNNF